MQRQFQNYNAAAASPRYIERPGGAPQPPQQPTKEKGVLFYSQSCAHSKKFLEALVKVEPLFKSIRKVCVDGNSNIPPMVTSVPTLIVRGINRPLMGEQVFSWLSNETKAANGASDDLMSFAFNAKDNYTLIDGAHDSHCISSNVAEWNKDYFINAPADINSDKKGSGGAAAGGMSDIAKYREDRNMQQPQRQAPGAPPKMDSNQFNKMFVKQQQSHDLKTIRNI
jgi:hypothetical protein